MNGLSVVIPSKTASNLEACVRAIRAAGENRRIIVVDDFPQEVGGGHPLADCNGYLAKSPGPAQPMLWCMGEKPFVFARNCNRGIKAAGTDDVILLNDDALLKTTGGFSAMQRAAEAHPEFGIISATTNVAGNPSQFPQGIKGLIEEPRIVAFVCVLIPRRTIEVVGLMDERFGGFTQDGRRIYGFCDNDYCRRIRNEGLKIGIYQGGCFVDHGSLRSSFRGDPGAAGDISAGAELYQAKWGDLN